VNHKQKGPRWKELMADFFELPREVLLNLPRLTMLGNQQVLLENHRGIIYYDSEEIRLGIRGGELIITGRDLQVQKIMEEEIYITGRIEHLYFEE